jgi:putative two-component system response regulator
MTTFDADLAQILSGGRSPLFRLAAQIALTHHERWDGHGYPNRLAGGAIPLVGRIVAVADAWDALTNDRPYRQARTENNALTELGRHAGTQFDPVVIDAFIRSVTAADRTRASA